MPKVFVVALAAALSSVSILSTAEAEELTSDATSGTPGAPPEDALPADLPAGTRSLRVVRDTSVVRRAGGSAVFGRVVAGTRVAVVRSAERPGTACVRWFEIAPRGWVCAADVAPSDLPPGGELQPIAAPGALVPDDFGYGDVARARPELVGADNVRTCTRAGPRAPEGPDFAVSQWVGERLDCADSPALPFAWVEQRLAVAAPVVVRAAPSGEAHVVRTLAPRTIVTPGAVHRSGMYVAVAPDGWVAASDVHVARVSAPPPHLAPGERWIDIDLDEQVLVAYEGTRPVHATLVSTGTPTTPTPVGTFRIEDKRSVARMAGEGSGQSSYRGYVPWTMYYSGDFAMHAAYWHDRFGARMSHGCINLAPLDARVLYHWTEPHAPEGWVVAKGSVAAPGTLIRVRNRHRPAPPTFGYAREVDAARRDTR